ncbi:MAG: hypothetical protein ABIF01_01950 [Candidatus Micrarchaeota archaeon]
MSFKGKQKNADSASGSQDQSNMKYFMRCFKAVEPLPEAIAGERKKAGKNRERPAAAKPRVISVQEAVVEITKNDAQGLPFFSMGTDPSRMMQASFTYSEGSLKTADSETAVKYVQTGEMFVPVSEPGKGEQVWKIKGTGRGERQAIPIEQKKK